MRTLALHQLQPVGPGVCHMHLIALIFKLKLVHVGDGFVVLNDGYFFAHESLAYKKAITISN
jgi:hypothetical protein